MAKVVLLGDIINDTKSGDILGISDRAKIISYIERAIEIAEYKTNWSRYIGDIDICTDSCGFITLPSFVDTVLAVNVNGFPAYPRNGWFEYHINGPGSRQTGRITSWSWDDKGWSPVFQQLTDWSLITAIVEDPVDGNGSLKLRVFGETVDPSYNSKDVLTIPPSGPSDEGVEVPLIYGSASPDANLTMFKKITRIQKPKTRGYVKLMGFNPHQLTNAVTLGYFSPHETNPSYRRIKVGACCTWCRVRFRRADMPLVHDYDVIPFPTRQGTLDLIKAIRLRETNNIDVAELYEQKALQLLLDIQRTEDGPAQFMPQIDPGFGIGTIDYR